MGGKARDMIFDFAVRFLFMGTTVAFCITLMTDVSKEWSVGRMLIESISMSVSIGILEYVTDAIMKRIMTAKENKTRLRYVLVQSGLLVILGLGALYLINREGILEGSRIMRMSCLIIGYGIGRFVFDLFTYGQKFILKYGSFWKTEKQKRKSRNIDSKKTS